MLIRLSTWSCLEVLRTGQGPLAGCYVQERDHWRGVKNRTETTGVVLRTGQGPLAGCYVQDRDHWRGVKNRAGTIVGVLRTG